MRGGREGGGLIREGGSGAICPGLGIGRSYPGEDLPKPGAGLDAGGIGAPGIGVILRDGTSAAGGGRRA